MAIIRTTNLIFNGRSVIVTKHFLRRYAERMFNVDEQTSSAYIKLPINFAKIVKDSSVRIDKCVDVTHQISEQKLKYLREKYSCIRPKIYKHNHAILIATLKNNMHLFLTCYYE